MNMSVLGVTFSLLILLSFSNFINSTGASLTHANGPSLGNETAMEEVMVPVMEEVMVPVMEEGLKMEMMVINNESRRKLGSFQICALCTCCGGARGVCLPSPCCYAINCNIPNRPFGFCSFTPKTCNCFGCHL